jgi:uncharacterized membrane protein
MFIDVYVHITYVFTGELHVKKKIKTEDPVNGVETTEHEEEHKKKKKKKAKNEHVENESMAYGKKFTDFGFH